MLKNHVYLNERKTPPGAKTFHQKSLRAGGKKSKYHFTGKSLYTGMGAREVPVLL
jgi:hypothetical protein